MPTVRNPEPFSRLGWRPVGINQHKAAQLGGATLGGMVPDGSVVTYQGTWTPTYTKGATDVISEVEGALASEGLIVNNVSSDAGFLDTTVLGMTIQPKPFSVTMQIFIQTGSGGFGQEQDVASLVNHAVYQATGMMPISSSVPSVQRPGSGTAATGQAPGASTPGLPGAQPTDWGTWFQQNFGLIAAGVLAFALLPPLLGAFGGRR